MPLLPASHPRRRTAAATAVLAAALLLGACERGGMPATIWTDVPEFALYAELFNAEQTRYAVEVSWREDLAGEVRDSRTLPSLVMGRFLKSQAVRTKFQSLDYLFGELAINQAAFYPSLLQLGNMEGRQLLLPVAFSIPAILFPAGKASPPDSFLVGLKDMETASAGFNRKQGAGWVALGFSPRWDRDFLVIAASQAGAAFREARPLGWSEAGLKTSVEELARYSAALEGGAAAADEFQFKYLYTPPYRYLAEGRALFAYMDAPEFFLVPEEKRSGLDYRWFAREGKVPVNPGIVYAAIPRTGREKTAAEAFLKWFFAEDSQRRILEAMRKTRTMEGSFGIAEGFSAVRSVNEKVFPQFYPALVGHLPPAEALEAPNVLPSEWQELQEAVVAPWLLEATARTAAAEKAPGTELAERLAAHEKQRSGGQ